MKKKKIRFLSFLLLFTLLLGMVPLAHATGDVQNGTEISSLEPEPSPAASDSPSSTEPKTGSPEKDSTQESSEQEASYWEDSDWEDEDLDWADWAPQIIPEGGKTVALPANMLLMPAGLGYSGTMTGGKMLYTSGSSVKFSYSDAQGTQHSSSYIWLQPYYMNGSPSFCIEPAVHVAEGMTYSENPLNDAWSNQLTKDQRYAISVALAYGYPNTWYDKAAGDSNDAETVEAEKLLATQAIIWEIVAGLRSSTAPYACTSSPVIEAYYDWYPTMLSVWQQISDAMAKHTDIPSFASQSQSNAPTYELTYDSSSGTYKTTLTDARQVLEDFNFTSSISGLTLTRSGNVLNIEATPAAAQQLSDCTFSASGHSLDVGEDICLVWSSDMSGYQTQVSLSAAPDPVSAYFKLTASNPVGNLVVTKTVNYGTTAGFIFRLYGTSDSGKTVDLTATTGSDGRASFRDVPVGTYTLEELNSSAKYITPSAQQVTIVGGETATATMTNTMKFWRVTVTKTDGETGTAQGNASLDGAEYTLYLNGTAVDTYTIQSGSFTTNWYPCTTGTEQYALKETKAPTGYLLDDTAHRLVTGGAQYQKAANDLTLSVTDTVTKGSIQLTKYALNTVSGDKQPEEGATFAVYLKSAGSYDAAKEAERDIITIGKDGKGTSKSLPYGTYCVQQRTSWTGYDKNEATFEATISQNGQTVMKDSTGQELTLNNNIWTGKLSILKVDGADNTPLSGAVFTLTGSDGTESTLTTGEDGTVTFENLVYGVDYTWAETTAPKGYLLNENNTGTWAVSKHDDSQKITCKDDRRPGAIQVTKENSSGEPLSGCTLLLEYKDGDTWEPVYHSDTLSKGGTSAAVTDGKLTTDASGKVSFENLWADGNIQYRLTEVAAPEGYSLLKEPVFEGTLPVSYPDGKVSATPDEVIDGTAYFYNLPVTVQNGHIYTLPMTGGSGFPFVGVGIAALVLGLLLFANVKYPIILKNLKRRITHEI